MSFMTDFRPESFDQVVGHWEVTKILNQKLKKANHPRVYLFSGGSGLGKTTFGRIIANVVDATKIEFDAGNLTGVDAVRDLIADANRKSITGKKNKIFIIDECHMLSKSAWNALLKTIEEPGKNTYFVFCTTEVNKVPKTIVTRCLHFVLKSLSPDDIIDILDNVDDHGLEDEYIRLISRNCDGSPRKALSLLEKAVEIDDIKKFKRELNSVDEDEMDGNVIDICRELVKKKPSMKAIMTHFKQYSGSYEGMRIQIFNYLTAVTMNNTQMVVKLMSFEQPIKSETTGKGEMLIKIVEATEE